METTPEEGALAKVLYESARAYGRSTWDDWLYKHQARAVLAAGYGKTGSER